MMYKKKSEKISLPIIIIIYYIIMVTINKNNNNNVYANLNNLRINNLTKSTEHSNSNSNDYKEFINIENNILEYGICQIYTGVTCEQYLKNQSVFIPPDITMDILEDRLKAAYGVIKESKDMNPNCRVYALPSLCFSILPICRKPELTNHQYFANKAIFDLKQQQHQQQHQQQQKLLNKKLSASPSSLMATQNTQNINEMPDLPNFSNIINLNNNHDNDDDDDTIAIVADTYHSVKEKRGINVDYLQMLKKKDAIKIYDTNLIIERKVLKPDRSTEDVRRICRDDCELLENELCQKEYAIAKRHPTIGQKLPLEECDDLPADIDCMKLGIVIDVSPEESCYWENGAGYRGAVATSMSGKTCLKWVRLMKEIADYPELAGQNYCRNPGGLQPTPWCYVDNNSIGKVVEHCEIPKCSDRLWIYIIVCFVLLKIIIITVLLICVCKRCKKRDVTNIQNINLPNADKNIYGNSRLNSPLEMTSLLTNQGNNLHGIPSNTGRSTTLRVTQYSLQDVKFVEELGEGAFGKVYKGELLQENGKKLYVAVKALKENASVKTQTDFRREIELISDLKHDNIVCILGVVLREEPLCMLFEYMTQGDLHEFLIGNSPNECKNLSQLQFLQISMQICDGMEYLAGHHYVHRDLAARNCLVGDNLTVKISDFGLSRDIYSSDYYRVQSKSLLPVRWMPSESILYGKFTTESDVWSFGVVLWEIYSYGLQPYYGYSNQEVISMVRARQLLPCPEVCPSAVYSLMVECWHEQAVRRPSFAEIGHRLKIWYQGQKRNEQVDNFVNYNRKGSTHSMNNRSIGAHSNSNLLTNSKSDYNNSLKKGRTTDGQRMGSSCSSSGSSRGRDHNIFEQQQLSQSQSQPQQSQQKDIGHDNITKEIFHQSLDRNKCNLVNCGRQISVVTGRNNNFENIDDIQIKCIKQQQPSQQQKQQHHHYHHHRLNNDQERLNNDLGNKINDEHLLSNNDIHGGGSGVLQTTACIDEISN